MSSNYCPEFHGEILARVLPSGYSTRKRLDHMHGMLQMAPTNYKELMATIKVLITAWVTIVTVDSILYYLKLEIHNVYA